MMDVSDPDRARVVLRDLLTRAGRIALDLQRTTEARLKPDGSPVTDADKKIDAWLGEALADAFPGVGVKGEEGSDTSGPNGTFFMDPIDGTHAYMQRLAYWGPTVALVQDGQLVFGAFYVPPLDEFWFAARGYGAFRDDERLICKPMDAPPRAQMLFVPSRFHRHPALDWPGKVRALGSSAAHLAHVAAGAGVATVIPRWSLWDVGCGALLVTESGGALSALDGGPVDVVNGPQGLPFLAGAPSALRALAGALVGEPMSRDEDEVEPLDREEELGDGEEGERRPVPSNLPALGAPPSSVRSKKDLLSYYLSEVRRYPLLTREEEHEYAVKFIETGDPEAAERLVTANLRLVIKIAFQYHRQWANVLDLIQEGNVGLVEALSRYDPYREIRFSSYAQYWIRAMILRFLLDNFRLVRLGSTRAGRKLFFQLQKERDRLLEEGKSATPEALAERLGVTAEDVADVDQHMRAPALSLHAPAGDDPDGRTLSDMVPERIANNPETNTARNELGSIVSEKLATFAEALADDRERAIWTRRLVATDPESLSVLGDEFGVSKERVRQLEARIKKRLKAFLEAELGDEIDFEFSSAD